MTLISSENQRKTSSIEMSLIYWTTSGNKAVTLLVFMQP